MRPARNHRPIFRDNGPAGFAPMFDYNLRRRDAFTRAFALRPAGTYRHRPDPTSILDHQGSRRHDPLLASRVAAPQSSARSEHAASGCGDSWHHVGEHTPSRRRTPVRPHGAVRIVAMIRDVMPVDLPERDLGAPQRFRRACRGHPGSTNNDLDGAILDGPEIDVVVQGDVDTSSPSLSANARVTHHAVVSVVEHRPKPGRPLSRKSPVVSRQASWRAGHDRPWLTGHVLITRLLAQRGAHAQFATAIAVKRRVSK